MTAIMLAKRRFVVFDAAQVDVNTIVAMAYQLQDSQARDPDGNIVTTSVKVAVVMLDTGSSITLGGSSLEKFEHWWEKNVKSEKVELPKVVASPPVPPTPPVPQPAAPAVPPAPAMPTPPTIPPAPAPPAATPDAPVADTPAVEPPAPPVAK